MKPILWSLLLALGCSLPGKAQQPVAADSCRMQADEQADTSTIEAPTAGDPFAQDSVWQEATAGEGLDFKVFGRHARDDKYYGQLAERFEKADTTLFGSDFLVLYYGYAYRDEYDGGYGVDPWNEATKEKRYTEAYDALNSALKKAPATPHALSDALWIARELGRPDEEVQRLEWRLYALLTWISLLRDGSEQYPAVVVNVRDEYTFMYDYMGVRQVLGQQLIRKDDGIPYDKIDIEPLDTSDSKISEVWFDVSYPFTMLASPGHWAKNSRAAHPQRTPPPKARPTPRPRVSSRDRDTRPPRFAPEQRTTHSNNISIRRQAPKSEPVAFFVSGSTERPV